MPSINSAQRPPTKGRVRLLGALLAPVLLPQGFYVRQVTPKLPEAAGPRCGQAGDGPSLKLLILGDSAAAGVGAENQEQALSGQVQAALRGRFRLHWRVAAQSGQRIGGLLQQILDDDQSDTADVIIVSIGVNDVTGGTRHQRWSEQVDELLGALQQRYQPGLVLLSALPPMHAFPALPQPLRFWLGERARQFTAVLYRASQQAANIEYLEADFPHDRDFAASDGFHPGPPAYSLWAQRVAQRISEGFVEG